MKKLIITTILFFRLTNAYSQTVNGIPLKDLDIDYVDIVGTQKYFSTDLKINIDFGKENKLLNQNKDNPLKDENGKKIVFNSMIDALNFMSKNNYELVQAYEDNKNIPGFHYVLRKKK
jgi:hypothetical protein